MADKETGEKRTIEPSRRYKTYADDERGEAEGHIIKRGARDESSDDNKKDDTEGHALKRSDRNLKQAIVPVRW